MNTNWLIAACVAVTLGGCSGGSDENHVRSVTTDNDSGFDHRADGGADANETDMSAPGVQEDAALEPDGSGDDRSCDEVCDQAPPPGCVDETTLGIADADGVCAAGACEYEISETTCSAGCADAACAPCADGQWFVTMVGERGLYPQLASDSEGTVHMLYFSSLDGLTHASRIRGLGGWRHQPIWPDGGSGAGDLVVGPDGSVHVSFAGRILGRETNDLWYAVRRADSDEWGAERVDDTPFRSVDDTSIALSPSGEIHIAYQETTDLDLKHASRAVGGSWSLSTVDQPDWSGYGASLAVDAAGGLHIAHEDHSNKVVRYSSRPPDQDWKSIDVPETVRGQFTKLANTPEGTFIVFFDSLLEELKLSQKADAGGEWTTTTLDNSSGQPGLSKGFAADRHGGLHLAYSVSGGLRYAYRPVGGSWIFHDVETPGERSAFGVTLAVDRFGEVHISYYEAGSEQLHYARRTCPQ